MASFEAKQSEVTVAGGAASMLRERILSGDLAPGQRLIEADLTAEFAISRSALREAFIQLSAEGLVELRHQRGAAVTRLTREDMAELFAVRERLEGFAAFLAAQRVDAPGNREWLEAQRANWLRSEMLQNECTHLDDNIPFHEGVARLGGNDRLIEILRRLQVPAYRLKFLKVLTEERRQESVEDHVMVIDAILAGDAEKAEEMMRLHVKRTGELAQQIDGLS